MIGVAEPMASRRVACAFQALDLFGGCEEELISWIRSKSAEGPVASMTPPMFDVASARALQSALRSAEVIDSYGGIDAMQLSQFRETVELLPCYRAEQDRRVPVVRTQVAFTLPKDLRLVEADAHVARSLTVRMSEALRSATSHRVLLSSPYWSRGGTSILRPSFNKAIELNLHIVLAGARARRGAETYDHLAAMCGFGAELRAAGATVTCFEYRSSGDSLFHAKLACGLFGYLGSGNFTEGGLSKHVEAGVVLEPVDVKRIWWLIETLRHAELLVEVP